jgi:P pilus assembly chaperone PapD
MLHLPIIPRTENDLYIFILILTIAYLVLAYGLCLIRTRSLFYKSDHEATYRVFNSLTFASSIVLMIAIIDKAVLELIGNVKPFLIVAALTGLSSTLIALLPEKHDKSG